MNEKDMVLVTEQTAPVMACSPRVAGKMFNVNQWHITQACNRGEISKHAVGRKVVILVSDIEEWIRSRGPAPAPSSPRKKRSELLVRSLTAADVPPVESAPMSNRKYKTITEGACALLKQVAYTDRNGVKYGFTYEQILAHVKTLYPVVTYKNPHAGRPSSMTIKGLREIAYKFPRREGRLLRQRKSRGGSTLSQTGSAVLTQADKNPFRRDPIDRAEIAGLVSRLGVRVAARLASSAGVDLNGKPLAFEESR